MAETKELKIRFSTVICIILIVLLLAGCGILYYFGFVQKDKELEKIKAEKAQVEAEKTQIETKNTELEAQKAELEKQTTVIEKEAETKKTSDIPTTDLTVAVLDNGSFFYGYIENGKLNYYMDYDENLRFNPIYQKKEIKQLNEINNVKRIKVFNPGTSVDPIIYLITEDGKVYISRLSNRNENNEIYFMIDKEFEEYEVENILVSEFGYDKLLLKDGTTKELSQNTPN